MAKFRLSVLAEADLSDIGDYTLRTWGEDQALQYIGELEACCRQLALNPQLGRACDYILPGLRRIEHEAHVLFYRIEAEGVAIIRILHKRMLPEKQIIGYESQQS